ncbi:MAG TPA: AI-2E family transporter [Gemmatimonadales bacterium]|nr:AI-2E family transporter [Gemmatimonadales bacterium]
MTRAPTIQPDDGSILTPDVTSEALAPAPGPTGEQPDARMLTGLFGENADARHISLVGLFVLAVLYTLHFAQSFVLPIVVAILLDFLLSPVVRALRKLRIPEPLGAGIVMLGLLAALGMGSWYLSGPASSWLARAPESMATVRTKLQELRQPVEKVTEAAEQVEEVTSDVGKSDGVQQVEIKGPSMARQLFGGTATMLSAATIVVFLTYFLLAVGDLFLQKLVTVLPQFRDKKKAVAIARETEAQISVYLFTATLINIGVGVVTGIALWLIGMPNPVLWGVVAAVLNFVPYIGAVVNMAILGLAALLSYESTTQALLVPAVFFGINMIEGNLVTPMILGHRMQLNTVALFVGLVFWWYLWGIPGAILGVPIMAAIKIMCDHIEALAPVGEFLGK